MCVYKKVHIDIANVDFFNTIDLFGAEQQQQQQVLWPPKELVFSLFILEEQREIQIERGKQQQQQKIKISDR